MDTNRIIKSALIIAFLISSTAIFAQQKKKLVSSASKISVEGTSTIHDWEIDVEEFSGNAEFATEGDNLKIISSDLKCKVNSMKSGKSSMDDVTYEAMKEVDYPEIVFKYHKTEKITKTTNGYKAVVLGYLTIADEKKLLRLNIDLTTSGDKIIAEGSAGFKMSTFGIDPPTAVFGTIKSGDFVTVKYKLIYK